MARRVTGGKAVAGFEGTAEVLANLDRYEKRLMNTHLMEAYMDGAELVRADAQARAPRGETGRLADRMVAEKDTRRRRAVVGPHKDAFYGIFQERGTSRHAAQPFLRPALDNNRRAVFLAIGRELKKATEGISARRL